MQSWWSYLSQKGIKMERVLGMDEVGRGPLAGPVCVGGVVLPKNHGIRGLDDSKKLSEKRREELCVEIYAVGQVWVEFESNVRVDKDGIAVCIRRMMRKIAKAAQADFVLADAMAINLLDVPQMAITKGDSKVDCIAAASIVAKVARDRLMVELEQKYPGYGLAGHKGYGTKFHRDAIGELGLCKIHRVSFCGNI